MAVKDQRALRGQRSFHAGNAAEDGVARHYQNCGCSVVESRWRGSGGEIDLILSDGVALVFVEVKHAANIARAAGRISPRQMQRIYATAEEYLGLQPRGALTEARFDVALVDGQGVVHIIENAFGEA
ncbi:MAG: YraN family protein [Paracoccaceae bacterium]|nr:YraN family protein [Paracoccaceae bacterium]